MNLTDWVVGNLKPYKLALNSPTRIGSFLPTIYGCVLPTLTDECNTVLCGAVACRHDTL